MFGTCHFHLLSLLLTFLRVKQMRSEELDANMRYSTSLSMPLTTCQFGNILEVWGDADAAHNALMELQDYDSRLAAAHQWPLFSTGWCHTHGQQCHFARSMVRVQGPPCPDYSLCGKRRGVEGKTFPALLAAGAKARATNAALCIVENVPGSVLGSNVSDLNKNQQTLALIA